MQNSCWLAGVSRHNWGPTKGLLYTLQYDSVVTYGGFQGVPSIWSPSCRGTPVSRTAARVIAVVVLDQDWDLFHGMKFFHDQAYN